MSNTDWDTVTKIGSRVSGGGGGPRQTTIKNRSQLNAAQRAGAVVGTEKKYGTANSGRAAAGTGQFQTKVAETNDIVKQKFMDPKQAQALTKAATGMKTSDIQRHTSINGSMLSKYLGGANRPIPTQQEWAALERALGFHLRGAKMGTPNGSKTALPRPEATQSKAAE